MASEKSMELCRLIAQSYGLYNEKIARRFKSAHADALSGLQYMLLNLISDAGRITAGDLATRAMIQKQQATKVLNQLEDKGLIERARQSDNRRAVWLNVTEAGRQLLGDIHADFAAQISAAFDRLDDASLDRYTDAMRTINDILTRFPIDMSDDAPEKQ